MNEFDGRAMRLRWMLGLLVLCLILVVLTVVPVGATEVGSAPSAGETLTLAFFTPVQMCQVRYCLTADLVSERVNAAFPGRVRIVEVPVVAFHVYHDGTPPDFLHADWRPAGVEPVPGYTPEPVLTQFGWGLAEPQMLLVDDSGRVLHDFGDTLDIETLARVLDGG